ncbi:dihydrofolate reductase family protein, partial [bacterium]|nr:dihydrofolate reductase family protein [bacterium]
APRAEPRPACVDTDLSGVAGWGRDAILAFAGDGVDRDRVRGLAASGVEVVLCRERGGRVDLQDLLDRALARGLHVLMVEGGPTLASSLLAAGLVDRWVQFVAPQVLGEGVGWPVAPARTDARDFSLTRALRFGADACMTWDRTNFSALRAGLTRTRSGRGEA